jgi:hypothetical protein
MNDRSIIVTEVISRKDTRDFLLGINNALLMMSCEQVEEVYLFVKRRNAIAISFDSTWRPFIGVTRGYNCPEDRTYFSGGPFLALIKSRFRARPREIAGGRVFLTSDYAYHTDGMLEEVLLQYIWLSDRPNIIEDVLILLSQRRC